MKMDKITMDKKWAFRSDPFTEVRVLCVDAGRDSPVIALRADGLVIRTEANGFRRFSSSYDLVPLQHKPREWWVNVYPTFVSGLYSEECEAKLRAKSALETIHVIEVLED